MHQPQSLSKRCIYEPRQELSNNVVCATSKCSDKSAHTRRLTSLCWSLKYSINVKLLTKPHLKFLSLNGGCTGLSESTLVKIPHCWKSHDTAQLLEIKTVLTQCPYSSLRTDGRSSSLCLRDYGSSVSLLQENIKDICY